MGEFVRVTGTTDVKPGHGIVAEVNGRTLAVFNADESFHAIDNTCIHGLWRVKRETPMVSLVNLVCLVCLVERDKPDERNRPDEPV